MATTLRLNPSEMATLRFIPRGFIDNGDDTYSAQDIQRRTTSSADDSSPAWSNDCALLAFSSNRANPNYYNIYQLDVSNNNVTPITSGNYEDLSPSWSPDGSKIAFTRTVGNASGEIYVHTMSSGQDLRLTNNNVNDTDPSWSPSGRIIFARHSEDGGRAALFEMDAVDANGDGNRRPSYSQSRPQTSMNMTRSRSIPAVEKRSSSFEVRKLAGADLEMCGNSSFRTGPSWIRS